MKRAAAQCIETLLKQSGFRVTPCRKELLSVLQATVSPLSIPDIQSLLTKGPDEATVYRAVKAFVEEGIVREVHAGGSHARYELVSGQSNAHHVVCDSCGHIETVDGCAAAGIQREIQKKSRDFKVINPGPLQLRGICKDCARA